MNDDELALLSLAKRIAVAESETQLDSLIAEMFTTMNCQSLVFTASVKGPESRHVAFASRLNCAAWCSVYQAHRYHLNDSFLQRVDQGHDVVTLQQLKSAPLTQGQFLQLALAQENGFRSGGVVAAHAAGSWLGALYFGSDVDSDALEAKIVNLREVLLVVATNTLRWTLRTLKHRFETRIEDDSSNANKILPLLIEGRNTSEIALILGRSESQVDNWVKRCCTVALIERRRLLAVEAYQHGFIASGGR